MSGRSAYVRKEKTKVKDGGAVAHDEDSEHTPSIIEDFPLPQSHGRPMHFEYPQPSKHRGDLPAMKSGPSGSDDLAYARVRKPHLPVISVSGIERSSFRSLMDKKSEGVRKGLAKTFGAKKKKTDEGLERRPATSATFRAGSSELDSEDYFSPPLPLLPKSKTQQFDGTPEYIRPGPPTTKLPPIPQGPQLKRWMGAGRPPQPWNKLRKDPELWDPNGDTLIFLGHESHNSSRPTPSFRLSSHVLEATESRFFITLLREGSTEDTYGVSVPPSPISSADVGHANFVPPSRRQPTPPMSESSMGALDGQILYEINFPAPLNLSKADTLRHQVTTRNVFALLYQASLVGLNLFQALTDLHNRLEVYMPPDVDAAGLIIDYLTTKGLDDVRDQPSVAASLLAWSETQGVRWEEGWKEVYVHSAGMYGRLEGVADFRFVTPITRALLERASLELQVRVQTCEGRLADFDFGDMWPMMSSQPPPARSSFERCRMFFSQYYLDALTSWPPAPPAGEEQWLTRGLVQKLQKDFGALYDYLVNRQVTWDCSEERSGRKWNIVHAGNKAFDVETFDLPFTDLLVAFDNRHKYPHIPHPYPLVPESIPVKASKDNLFKATKKSNRPVDDKMAERRAALAYTESTNIYLLGSNFVNNDLVDAFVRFEKADRSGEVDPYPARRGRWVLTYFILQTLASVSVDTPNLRYTHDVTYHLNARLRGTPPWKGANPNVEEASHLGSYCWTIEDTWRVDAPVTVSRRVDNPTSIRSAAPSVNESDTGSSTKSPFIPISSKVRGTRSSNNNSHRLAKENEYSAPSSPGFPPLGFGKAGQWPVRGESRSGSSWLHGDFGIKDFDD